MEYSLQHLVELFSGHPQTAEKSNQTELGRSGNVINSPAKDELASAELQNLQSPSLGTVPVRNWAFSSYQKLPHPFCNQLQQLPIVDGSDVELLLDFLLGVVRMNKVAQWSVPMVYEVLYSHCKGEFLNLLISG
jgi:hypothetical protein